MKSMRLDIMDNKSIREIKDDFSRHFPGLKIEFVTTSHASGEGSDKEELIKGNPKLWELRKFHTELSVEIDDQFTVAQLEGMFRDRFGLHIQIFRQSGNSWLQTVNTDSWTLHKHVEHARHFGESHQVRPDEVDLE